MGSTFTDIKHVAMCGLIPRLHGEEPGYEASNGIKHNRTTTYTHAIVATHRYSESQSTDLSAKDCVGTLYKVIHE